MDDLISRQDVIDAVIKYCTKYDLRELLADIEALPSVEQAQATLDDVSNAYENGYRQGKFEALQWIPCSERLPEENMWTICQNNAGAMMIGKYDIEFGWMFPAYFDGIVAWMPLPKPYVTQERRARE